MVKILWIHFDRKIEFNVNYLEYLVLKNIFKKKKYKSSKVELKGKKYSMVVYDEYARLNGKK